MTTIVYRKGVLKADTQVTYTSSLDTIFTDAMLSLGLKPSRTNLKTGTQRKIEEVENGATFKGKKILAYGAAGDLKIQDIFSPRIKTENVELEGELEAFAKSLNETKVLTTSSTLVLAVEDGCYFYNVDRDKEGQFETNLYFHSRKDRRTAGTGSGWNCLMACCGLVGKGDVELNDKGQRVLKCAPNACANGDNWFVSFMKNQILRLGIKKNVQMRFDVYSNEITDVIHC